MFPSRENHIKFALYTNYLHLRRVFVDYFAFTPTASPPHARHRALVTPRQNIFVGAQVLDQGEDINRPPRPFAPSNSVGEGSPLPYFCNVCTHPVGGAVLGYAEHVKFATQTLRRLDAPQSTMYSNGTSGGRPLPCHAAPCRGDSRIARHGLLHTPPCSHPPSPLFARNVKKYGIFFVYL